ncbi:MAG: hypothetical protein GY841_15375 [FCB group bacterium]|nr:hypothetical protein [FCB group bacterium]
MTSFFTKLIMKFYAVIYRTDTLTTDRANLVSGTGPWNMSAQPSYTIDVTIDGGGVQNIVIDTTLFAVPSAATAAEVILQLGGIAGGFAIENASYQIVIATDTIGDTGSVLIGGDGGALLGYSTEATNGGAYDDVYGAPLPTADGTQTGANSRRELAPVTQLCQIDRNDWGKRKLTAGGESEKADIVVVLTFDNLAAAGLIDSEGMPKLRIGDRVDRILRRDGTLDVEFPVPPGMWVNKVERSGHGLTYFGTAQTNLFYLHCRKDRTIETE